MSAIPNSEKFVSDGKIDLEAVRDVIDFHTVDDTDIDPVTFEILQHKFSQLVEEMGSTIKNVSGSVVATDANDFQTTISDETGDLVEIGPYIFIQAAVIDRMIKWVLKNRGENPGIEEGDMFICNDPWVGALHQNDVALLKPVFHQGELFSWVSSTVHQVDIGGSDPGSFVPSAEDVFQESTPMPPVKIVEDGEIKHDIEDLYLRRSRTPPALGLDLRAKIAANNVASDRIHEMIDRFGAETVKKGMKHSIDYAEDRFRDRLEELPDGTWRHENYLEVAKIGDRGTYRTLLEMEKQGGELTFRVSGDEQTGMINCTHSGLRGGILSAVLPLLAYDMPWALSAFDRVIDIEPDPGIIVNADFPAGVSMGTVSGSWHMINNATTTISKMMSASPEHARDLVAGSCGSWPTVAVLGLNQSGDPFADLFMDSMAGGWGGRSFDDGIDTGGIMCTPKGQAPSVERTEDNVPVLYFYRRELEDSGGAGEYRGGVGGEICWKPHDAGGPEGPDIPLNLTLTSFGIALPPVQGINGGLPPNSNLYRMLRDTDVDERLEAGNIPADIDELGDPEHLAPKQKTQQTESDVFHLTWGGGGGVGDPLDRDPERVLDDVVNNYVSRETARSIYGVVIDGDGLDAEVDDAATEARHVEIREQRMESASLPEVN